MGKLTVREAKQMGRNYLSLDPYARDVAIKNSVDSFVNVRNTLRSAVDDPVAKEIFKKLKYPNN